MVKTLLERTVKKASGLKIPGLFCLCLLVLLFSCEQSISRNDLQKIAGKTMGTGYSIQFYFAESRKQDASLKIKAAVEQRLLGIEGAMSTYREDSELSLLNKAPVSQWIKVSPELFRVLLKSGEIHQLSSGAFDVTVGPLVNLWGFGPEFSLNDIPEEEAVSKVIKERTGFEFLELDYAASRVKKNKDLYIDLSAIAKGYAVDQLALLLEGQGIDNYLVEIGGELRASGAKADGSLWKIAVEKPILDQSGQLREIQQVVELENIAVASSGDYRNFFEKDGRIYSHTIDPKTGQPVSHNLASVTVLHSSCMDADALATAFMVMGPEEALSVATSRGLALMLLLRNEHGVEQLASPAMKKYLN